MRIASILGTSTLNTIIGVIEMKENKKKSTDVLNHIQQLYNEKNQLFQKIPVQY
jgi:hypothetical protein